MSYLVLARKYRPGAFEEIIGQRHVTRTLQNAIRKGKVHHAFLFTGTRGVGKTTTARVLAKALCCLDSDGPTDTPCGRCEMCRAISAGNAVDINEIDGASNNSVNDIRDLRDNVQYRPQHARFKIYIIDEVHMLSTAAFNALLKTLEEPPEHVKFMFATTESHKIPQTILSRCQRYDFKSVSAVELAEHLRGLLEREGVSVSEGALATIGRLARGSVRDSLSLTDSVIAYAGESVSEEDVRTVLGLADAAVFERIVRALVDRNGPEVFRAVEELADYGHDIRQFGNDFLEYLRDLTLVRSHPAAAERLGRPDTEVRALTELSQKADPSEWIAWFDLMVEGQERIARSEQARYMLELTLAKMLQLGRMRPVDDLLAGLSRLARNLPPESAGTGRTSAPPPGAGTRPTRSKAVSETRTTTPAPEFPTDPGPDPEPPIDIRTGKPMPGDPLPEKDRANPPGEGARPPADWEGFVERFKTESRALWSALMTCRPLAIGNGRVRFEYPDTPVAFEQIGSPEGGRRLQEAAGELFGKTLVVEAVRGAAGSVGAPSLAEQDRAEARRLREQAVERGKKDETVTLLREVFEGGKVKVTPLAAAPGAAGSKR